MPNKIGFWPLLSIVIGSQVGSGVFMLPIVLSPYGAFSVLGWLIAGCGAVALAVVFGMLCSNFPKTGGPHIYVEQAFGPQLAFFVGWAYWIVSWVSTVAVIVASIGYLTPFISSLNPNTYIFLEIALLLSVVFLNLKGVRVAGRADFVLTLLKFLPLLIFPVIALYFFSPNNFSVRADIAALGTISILGQVTMLTMWGFIGLEAGTVPAGSVVNPEKTIPRAIIIGTICVACIYLINSIGIMGLIPPQDLLISRAPYADATKYIFGGNWHLLMSFVAAMVCVGTLNAWVLASSQIMLGLSEAGLVSKFFMYTNVNGAPTRAILASSAGIIPLLALTAQQTLAKQITMIIDISVIVFLFVYLTCALASLKLALQSDKKLPPHQWVAIFLAIIFCCGIILKTSLKDLLISSLFILSGIPVYLFKYTKTPSIRH